MVFELLITFLLLVSVSSLAYIVAARFSPGSSKNPEATSTYACGERLSASRMVVDPTLYEYSVYFLVFDSGIVLLAFASPTLEGSGLFVVIYLLVALISVLVLSFPGGITKIKRV